MKISTEMILLYLLTLQFSRVPGMLLLKMSLVVLFSDKRWHPLSFLSAHSRCGSPLAHTGFNSFLGGSNWC